MLKDESQISRQARWQRKHRAMGLCVLCSKPAFKGWRCKKHYEQHKITMRLRYIPKVRGRYKVGGSTLTEAAAKKKKTAAAKKKTAKAATKKTAAKKTVKLASKPAKKTTTRATAKKTTARKVTAKTTAKKTAARKKTTTKATAKKTAARKKTTTARKPTTRRKAAKA